DVAVAMNTGTQAAKEAGNMVDLDSNPTKLIEIVETGKQLLMTRGSLTTFSIANDVSKYFAIIPAAFASTYPALDRLNVMRLHSPSSAILSAVIFNALVIICLIPLALLLLTLVTGVAYPALVTVVAQAAFRHQANGSVIVRDGKPIGSELVGQTFSDARYFRSRPSAAGAGYDATAGSGSNLAPGN